MYKHNKLTKFLLFVLTLILSCCLFSCTNSTPPTNNPETPLEPPQNYQKFDLSLDNFSHFFDVELDKPLYKTQTNPKGVGTYSITGVLNYAYYDNVIVTLNITYKANNKTYNGEYTVKLNAAGKFSFKTDDIAILTAINYKVYDYSTQEQITVKSVSGAVILFQ